MCGIWGFITKTNHSPKELKNIYESFHNIKERGPDNSHLKEFNEFMNVFIGFHRLAIVDVNNESNQPRPIYHSEKRTSYITCNGEIYNYMKIINRYKFEPKTKSDAEAIVYLFENMGIDRMLDEIDGEFAIAIFEIEKEKKIILHLMRDHMGIRPMYYAVSDDGMAVAYSSELRGMSYNFGEGEQAGQIVENPKQVVPGVRYSFEWALDSNTGKINFKQWAKQFYKFNQIPSTIKDVKVAKKIVNMAFRTSIRARLMSKRPLGAFLSGGLDSSLMCAVAAEMLKPKGLKLKTFSIGLPGSTDEKFAKIVSKHIGSVHTHILVSKEDFVNALEDTVRICGTFDTKTIRSAVALNLMCQYVHNKTDIIVVLTGDGSDCLFGGYLYMQNAPNKGEFHMECVRRLREMYLYDLLKGDRCIADNQLEGRLPYLDRTFMHSVLAIDSQLRVPQWDQRHEEYIEKWLLRAAFEDDNILPKEVLWRKKEHFSDGVSSEKDSWYGMVQKIASNKFTDEQFEQEKAKYEHLPPQSKQQLMIRRMFEKFYGKRAEKAITGYWAPKWHTEMINEPSARMLRTYARIKDIDG